MAVGVYFKLVENENKTNHCVAAKSEDKTVSDLYNPLAFSFRELQRMVICQMRNGGAIIVLNQEDNGVHEKIIDFNGLDINAEQIRHYSIKFAAFMDHSDGFFFQIPEK